MIRGSTVRVGQGNASILSLVIAPVSVAHERLTNAVGQLRAAQRDYFTVRHFHRSICTLTNAFCVRLFYACSSFPMPVIRASAPRYKGFPLARYLFYSRGNRFSYCSVVTSMLRPEMRWVFCPDSREMSTRGNRIRSFDWPV